MARRGLFEVASQHNPAGVAVELAREVAVQACQNSSKGAVTRRVNSVHRTGVREGDHGTGLAPVWRRF